MKLKLTDVKLRVTPSFKDAHLWDGVTFLGGKPVSLCGSWSLFPRDPFTFISTEEMKTIPFCEDCLNMVER